MLFMSDFSAHAYTLNKECFYLCRVLNLISKVTLAHVRPLMSDLWEKSECLITAHVHFTGIQRHR